MKDLVILGGGTAGTILANRARARLDARWRVTVVDPAGEHLFRPALVHVPFGGRLDLAHRRASTFAHGVAWRREAVAALDLDRDEAWLASGARQRWDLLAIATGASPRPDLTPGLVAACGGAVHDPSTADGARGLGTALDRLARGRLVVATTRVPTSWPLAAVELALLAEDQLCERGRREAVDIVLATPEADVFDEPAAAAKLRAILAERAIRLELGMQGIAIDGDERLLRAHDGRELPFDVLAAIPGFGGAPWARQSGLGDPLGFVPTDPSTLRARGLDRVFVLGDATDLALPKAGSVATYQAEVLAEDLVATAEGRTPDATFDGHATAFVETGRGKAVFFDLRVGAAAAGGKFPLPGVGPLSLLAETRGNRWGQRALGWLYWHALLPGRSVPVPPPVARAASSRGPS